MRQVIKFYFLCCFGNLLFHFVSAYMSSDLQDIKFGFSIAMKFVILFYSPLCTFFAYIYIKTKINAKVMRHPLLYSLSPFLITYFITLITDINVCYRDYLIPCIFAMENIFIFCLFFFHYIKKKYRSRITKDKTSRADCI